MVQRSRFWDGTTIGDATVAPYDAGTEFSEVMTAVAGLTANPNKGGPLSAVNLTVPSAGTVRLAPFEAMVYGAWYQSDANIDFVVATPAAATRIDVLVLRKSWAAQTVRAFVITGSEGGAQPALVQTPGVTWDVPIATITITTAGAITLVRLYERADLWYRTGTDRIATDNHIGILGAPHSAWPLTNSILQFGSAGGSIGGNAGVPDVNIRVNSYYDGTVNRTFNTGPATSLSVSSNALYFYYAPSVTAGQTQAFSPLMSITQAGGMTLGSANVSSGSILFVSGGAPAVGEQRYVMGVAYQADFTIQDIVRNGPVAMRISRTTNTMTLGPNAGQDALAWGSGALAGDANPRLYSKGAQNVELYGNGGYVHPSVDGLINLGAGSLRWYTVFASIGAINTSSREVKQNIVPLDTQVAMDAVRATEAVTFEYIAPQPTPGAFELPEDIEQAEEILLFRMREAKAVSASRQQAGFIAEQADPLFSVGEGQAAASNSVGILLAAMQNIDARLRANGM